MAAGGGGGREGGKGEKRERPRPRRPGAPLQGAGRGGGERRIGRAFGPFSGVFSAGPTRRMFFMRECRGDREGDGNEGEDEAIVDGVRGEPSRATCRIWTHVARRRGTLRRRGPGRRGPSRSRLVGILEGVYEVDQGLGGA